MADTDTTVEIPEEGVVEVAVEGEEGAAPAPEKKAEAEPQPEPKKPVERVRYKEVADEASKALKDAQEAVDNERRLRQAAEQTATTAQQRAEAEAQRRQAREAELQQERTNRQAQELSRIDADIATTTSLIQSTQKELSAALSAGEFEKVAEVQTRLSKATAALDRHESRKADFENRAAQQPTHEGAVTEEAPPRVDPVEQYIGNMAPAAQTWLRTHRECLPPSLGGNTEMNAKMMRGHYEAVAKLGPSGVNSPDYFRIIDESTGYRQPEVKPAPVAPVEEEPKKVESKARPSAPVSREPPGTPQTGGTRSVRLTKEQQETAKFSFPNLTPQQAYAAYAKNLVDLESEGKLGRTSH